MSEFNGNDVIVIIMTLMIGHMLIFILFYHIIHLIFVAFC